MAWRLVEVTPDWEDYSENDITDMELISLSVRLAHSEEPGMPWPVWKKIQPKVQKALTNQDL